MSDAPVVTLLNVDDDEANRYAVSRTLIKAGYIVEEAATGAETLRRVTAAPPDMILLDVKLPDMNGIEVCRIIKADPRLASIPVLHLSASFITSADRAQGLQSGADGYLIKPVEPVELLATVNALLRMRRAEETARQAAQEWSATFEAIGDAICLLDKGGRILRANLALVALLQTPLPELLGSSLNARIEARFGFAFAPDLNALLASRQRAVTESDAGERSFLISADPIINDQNEAVGAALIFVDISERRRMEREERQRQAEIEGLNARLQRAMAETHHRVKNNLQVISALVDMQVMEDAPQVPLSEWKRLGMHIRTLAAVHDLLTAAVKSNQEADEISVEAALDRLLPMLQAMMGRRRLTARVADILLPSRLLGSLTILINELVSNAVKHGQGGIELTFEVADHSFRLEVCDDGPGFPPDFNPRRHGNTGMDLIDSTARHDLHGEIVFSNREQGGARVVVTMPLPEKERNEGESSAG